MAPAGDTASLWTLFTDRVNAVVWELPLSRRLKVWLSGIVFQNPPMPSGRAVETLTALEAAGLRAVLLGGWGVDALVGRQLRKHSDLDLLVEPADLDRAIEVLGGLGYSRWNEEDAPEAFGPVAPMRTVTCRDGALRVVDLHGADVAALEIDDGLIESHKVACLSAEQQLQTQVGKAWSRARRHRRRGNVAALEALVAANGR